MRSQPPLALWESLGWLNCGRLDTVRGPFIKDRLGDLLIDKHPKT
jgi:hypothetical protein